VKWCLWGGSTWYLAVRPQRRDDGRAGARGVQAGLVALILEGEGAHGAGRGLRGHQVVADVLRERLCHCLACACVDMYKRGEWEWIDKGGMRPKTGSE